MEEILTAEEVAAYIKMPVSSVYAKARRGEIPAIRIGRLYRFRKAGIDRWLDRQMTQPEEPSKLVGEILYRIEKKGYDKSAGKTRSNRERRNKCS